MRWWEKLKRPENILISWWVARTWLAAVALSMIWSFLWLFVFLFSTWYLDIQTSNHAFAVALMMSVAAESVIRFAENTKWAARNSKPSKKNPRPDNKDHKLFRAFSIFLMAGLLTVFAYGFFRTHFSDWEYFSTASISNAQEGQFAGDNCLAIAPSRVEYLLRQNGATRAEVDKVINNDHLTVGLNESQNVKVPFCKLSHFKEMIIRWTVNFWQPEVLTPFMVSVLFRSWIYRRKLPKNYRKMARKELRRTSDLKDGKKAVEAGASN